MRNRILTLLILLTIQFGIFGQSYPIGLNPSSLKWRQINTPKVNVIYPESAEMQAQRTANLVEYLYDSSFYSIGTRKSKVDIVIQNQLTQSNGLVTVGPFRSEFWMQTPMINSSGPVDFIYDVGIHEYRHVEQFVNARVGITRVGSRLFGQYTWGALQGIALPRWFFEGDAVYYETALTNAGRGRMPTFESEYRALLLTSKTPGYEKASATSLKDFVPNHYNLGYHLVTSLRRAHGPESWGQILDSSVRYRGVLFPFSHNLKKMTGLRTPQFYDTTMKELKSDWQRKLDDLELTTSEKLNSRTKRHFTNYENARYLDAETIVVRKSGFDQIARYVALKAGAEKVLVAPGFTPAFNRTLDIREGQLLWAEATFDPRWGHREYNVIKSYDLETGKVRRHTDKTRYFAPTYSPDGSRIAAIHAPASQLHELHILDATSSELTQTFPAKPLHWYSFPVWLSEDRIALIIRTNNQNAIGTIDISSGAIELITPFTDDRLAYLSHHGDRLYYQSTATGIENIFYLDLTTKMQYQVTSTAFGAQHPALSPDGSELVYSEYTAQGYDLRKINLNSIAPDPYTPQPSLVDFYKPTLTQGSILDRIPTRVYTSTSSSRTDLPHLHSWAVVPPVLINDIYEDPNLTAFIFANNTMSNLSATGYYSYNLNEKAGSWGAEIDFATFYPVITVGYQHANRNSYVPFYYESESGDTTISRIGIGDQTWNEEDLSIGITLPWNLSRRNYWTKLWITNSYHHLWVDYTHAETGFDGVFGAYEFDMEFYTIRHKALQHINPRWGVSLRVNYLKTLAVEYNDSFHFSSGAILYVPGLMRNHSLFFNLDYAAHPFEAQYKFLDNSIYPRGYGRVTHDNVQRYGVNYMLPLLYPDLALGPFAFIRRIKANGFLDYGISTRLEKNIDDLLRLDVPPDGLFLPEDVREYLSTGVEVTLDVRLFRLMELDAGFRYSRLLQEQGDRSPNQFEVLLRSIGF